MDTAPSASGNSPHEQEPVDRWEGHMSNGLGTTYGLTPMAVLSASPEKLLLVGKLGTFEFPRSSLIKIGRGGFYPWCFSAVRLHHKVAGIPEELQFKPLGVSAGVIRARLKSMGYPVA